MKILVTGGLGHIGSELIREFNEIEVVVVDNLLTQRYVSLFNLQSISAIKFIESNVLDLTPDKLNQYGPFSYIIHLAAITDAAGNADNKRGLFDNNLAATRHIAGLAISLGVPMIFPSSTSVYGSQDNLVDERCQSLLPQSPYAECKLAEEQYLREQVSNGLKVSILRLGTIHGASVGMRFHTAVNKFIFQTKLGMPLSVWSTALDQKRPYLSLSDAIRAFKHVIAKNLFNGETYNVLTDNWTVREIIECIELQNQKKCDVAFVDSPIMNQLSYEVSSSKFESTGFLFEGRIENDIRDSLRLLGGIN
jgi:nucleoside-diphosphate-sugar epimerase